VINVYGTQGNILPRLQFMAQSVPPTQIDCYNMLGNSFEVLKTVNRAM